MKSVYHYVRSIRRELVGRERLDVAAARDYFFARITTAVLHQRGLLEPHVSECVAAYQDGVKQLIGDVPAYISRSAAVATECISIPADVLSAMASDPTNIGWAYQFWNEAERDESTFAVSRQGEQEIPQRSLAAATQLFTEDYMSEVLVARCLLNRRVVAEQDLLDPACGTGHILVHAFRGLREQRRSAVSSTPHLMSHIFGCDIDPDAVELCRMVLLLEATQEPIPPSDVRTLWHLLTTNIQPLSSDLGTLDRAHECSLLHRTYGCVLSNPPYVGRRKLTDAMCCFLDAEYPATAMDLCSAFMHRCTELLKPGGWLGLVTVDKWLRLKGYEALRTGGSGFSGLYRMLRLDLVCELGQRAFSPLSSLHDGVGIALITAQRAEPTDEHVFRFISCTDLIHHSQKAAVVKALQLRGEGGTDIPQRDVMTRGSSTSFVVHHGVPLSLITSRLQVGNVADVVVGLQTGDDRRFVKYVWSVPPDKGRWLIHSKGGGYERWYGLNRYLLDWGEGRPVFEKTPKSGLTVERWFPEQGWTYTWFANGALGLRVKECGWSFGRAAASGFFCEDPRLIGFMNSRVASFVARRRGGKAQLPEGVVRALPLPRSLEGIDVRLIEAAVALKRAIIKRDMTDASFRPSPSFDPFVMYSLQALLLVVEGELERQVSELVQMDAPTRQALDVVMDRPVGWNLRAGEIDDESVWRRIPDEFHALRSLVGQVTAMTVDTCADRIQKCLTNRTRAVSGRPLPATSLIESVSRSSGAHPFDAVKTLAFLVDTDERVASEVVGPLLRSRIVEIVLSELGHQWWATTDVFDSNRLCVRSIDELTHAVAGKMGSWESERILGQSVKEWIGGNMELWHRRLFHNEPLLVAHSTNAQKRSAFGHRWSSGSSVKSCGKTHGW